MLCVYISSLCLSLLFSMYAANVSVIDEVECSDGINFGQKKVSEGAHMVSNTLTKISLVR